MPKRTSNSSVNSSIRQNTSATNEGFSRLLELQQATNSQLETIADVLTAALLMQRVTALEEIITAKEIDKEEDVLRDIYGVLKSIAKSLQDSVTATVVSGGGTSSSSNASTAIVAKSKEEKNESKMADDEKNEILKGIEKNTRPRDISKAKGGEGDGGLGGWLTALAAGLGIVVGALRAQFKAITYFAKLLTPDFVIAKIQKGLTSFISGLSMSYDLVKATITEKFSGVIKFFDGVVDAVKGVFSALKESSIGKVIKTVVSGLGNIMAPFVEAFETVKGLFSGPSGKMFDTIKGIFTTIGENFSKFAKVFKSVATIAEKILLPVTIVMTLWDTVKGAIEGFEKDGIVGGIAGAIKGFFNSLIFGPVDMIKDAAAWVLGVFGFDKAKEALESFDLEKTFSSFVDAIFSPVETFKKIMNKFNDFLSSLKGFTIPEFSFTIPIINKKVAIGPFKPFGEAGQQSNDVTGSSDSVVSSNSVKPLTSASVASSPSTTTSSQVTTESGTVAAMKENNSGGSGSTVVAPSINNSVNKTTVNKVSAPVRIGESTIDRYFSTRLVY